MMGARVIGRTGNVRGVDVAVSELLTLGSGRGNELRIDSRTVSRQHAQIVRSGSAYFVEDLGSRNGTFLNGQRVKRFSIRHLDVVSIGPDSDLIFLEGDVPTSVMFQRRPGLSAAIVWLDGPLIGSVEEIGAERGLLLGRRPELAAFSALSRRHAVLTIRDGRLTVEDLGSANGTWVKGTSIDSVTAVTDGDEISLANLLRVRVSLNTGEKRPEDGAAGPDPLTLAIDRPPSGGTRVLERPRPWPPRPAPAEAPAVDATPAAVGEARKDAGPEEAAEDATRVAGREPAIAPSGLGASPEGAAAIVGDATTAAPREPVVVPVFGAPMITDDSPDTFAQPRESVGVPQSVIELARAVRDGLGATDVVPNDAGPLNRGGLPPPPPVPKTVLTTGQVAGLLLSGSQDVELNRGTFVVGRHPGCDVHINSRDVGRRHAQIHVRESGIIVEDLGTANGTFVNDQLVAGETELPDECRVRFATVEFAVKYLRSEGHTP